jgi:hypothetical protein
MPHKVSVWFFSPSICPIPVRRRVLRGGCLLLCLAGASVAAMAAVSVSVSPLTATVPAGKTQQFTATVAGATNVGVTWTVNKVAGGDATVGTVSTTGLYTAPAAVPSPTAVTVTATSKADTTKSGSATVTVSKAAAVAVSPLTATVPAGKTQQFTATITGASNVGVTWMVNKVAGGNSTVGTVSTTGLYTAPAAVPSPVAVTVTAISKEDPAKSGSSTVTVSKAAAVAVSPLTATVPAGKTQQFTASVTGASNVDVTWTVNKVAGGNATVGTVSTTGLYTAPAAVPSPAAVTVTATSKEDTAKSGSTTVTVSKAAAVAVSPLTATVQTGKTQQFTATVTGASNVAVNWTVNKAAGGNSTVGTVSTTGLYTAPAAMPSPAAVTVTATSQEDTTKSGAATVTVAKASTGFAISSLSATTIDPLAVLTITGTGFTPASAAIAVVFTPSAGTPITVPVSVVTATTLQVAAPLYFNTTTGTFTAGTFSVQAVQLTSTTLSTSNVIAGLHVNAPPAVPSSLPTGTVTSLFLQTSVEVSSSVQAAAATKSSLSTVAADQYTYSSDVNTLLTGVNKVVAAPSSTTTLATSNGPGFTVNAKILALSDQLIWTRVLQYSSQAGIPAAAILPAAVAQPEADPAPVCTTDSKPICIEGLYETKEVTFTASQTQFAAGASSFIDGTLFSQWAAEAKAGAGSLASQAAAGLQLVWTGASSYFAAHTTPATPPAVPSAPNNAAATVVQNIALSGQGILPAALDAALSNMDSNKVLKSSTTAPTGGALLAGSQFNGKAGYNVLDVFQIINGVPTITEFDASDMQGVDASSAAALNPVIPAGTYNTVGYAYLGPVTCCTSGGCFTIPPQSGDSTSTDTVDAGTTLKSYTTAACTAWGSAAKGGGCLYPGCNCEEGTNSFGCSFTCTIPPQAAGCGSGALTGNIKATLQ